MTRRRRSGPFGCLAYSLMFWPFAGFMAWPFLAWHGGAAWIAAAAWWLVLLSGLVGLLHLRHR